MKRLWSRINWHASLRPICWIFGHVPKTTFNRVSPPMNDYDPIADWHYGPIDYDYLKEMRLRGFVIADLKCTCVRCNKFLGPSSVNSPFAQDMKVSLEKAGFPTECSNSDPKDQ